MSQIDDLREEADLCRVEGAEDIAVQLDDAANTIARLAKMCKLVEWIGEDGDLGPYCPWCKKSYGAMFKPHYDRCDFLVNHVAELAGGDNG